MSTLDTILSLLARFKYAAMFGVLVLCGLGLPLPEEVTLLASGLAVGWKEADFLLATLACMAGILVGDSITFALGRYLGRPFLASRPMRLLLSPRRQKKVHRLFAKHGTKAVFFARFFAGIRVGVYAYAGQHGMAWSRFVFLDSIGALVSCPTSIWVGKFAAEKLADPAQARDLAIHILDRGRHWFYFALAALIVILIVRWLWFRRVARRTTGRAAPLGAAARAMLPRVGTGVGGGTPDSP
jgi:membrane protein DedA with SNARE-associated domain